MKRIVMTFFLISIWAGIACAKGMGGMDSGGGTGFIMQDGSVHFLDIYEAQNRHIVLNLGTPGLSVEDRVNEVFEHIAKVAPARTAIYQDWAKSFYQDIEWIGPDQEIENPSDLGGVIVPANSKIVQLCFQRSGFKADQGLEKRFVVKKDLYDKLPADDQVALIVHEIIYREMLAFNMNSAPNTRMATIEMLNVAFNWKSYVELMANGIFGVNEFLGVIELDARKLKDSQYIRNAKVKIKYSPDCRFEYPTSMANFPVATQTAGALSNLGIIPLPQSSNSAEYAEYNTTMYNGHPNFSANVSFENYCASNPYQGNHRNPVKYYLGAKKYKISPILRMPDNLSIEGLNATLVYERRYKGAPTDGDLLYSKMNTISDQATISVHNKWIMKVQKIATEGVQAWVNFEETFIDKQGFQLDIGTSSVQVELANNTGFAKGSIVLRRRNSGFEVVSVNVEKKSSAATPKVGDIIN